MNKMNRVFIYFVDNQESEGKIGLRA